jgi:hypothetical protein
MAWALQEAGCTADGWIFLHCILHILRYGLTDFNLCTDGNVTHSGGNDLTLISLLMRLEFEEAPLDIYFYNSRLE